MPLVQKLLDNSFPHGAGGACDGEYGHDDYLRLEANKAESFLLNLEPILF
jgi:hypothetical protein